MRIDRRTLLKSGTVAGGIAAVPIAAKSFDAPALVIFDSRSRLSCIFAQSGFARKIDVAAEDANFWRALRAANKGGRVEGITSWSDWVLVRGLLEEKGLRVKQEAKAGKMFRWTMA